MKVANFLLIQQERCRTIFWCFEQIIFTIVHSLIESFHDCGLLSIMIDNFKIFVLLRSTFCVLFDNCNEKDTPRCLFVIYCPLEVCVINTQKNTVKVLAFSKIFSDEKPVESENCILLFLFSSTLQWSFNF